MSPDPIVHPDVDHVLTTTRAVRKRMDCTRPVDRSTVERCLELALQAPSGANRQDWRFLAIDDASLKKAVGDVYLRAFTRHYGEADEPTEAGARLPAAVAESAREGARSMAEAPVLVVPYRESPAPVSRQDQASWWASILPAAWSFMLAARSRGLVTSYTARGLDLEGELADLLEIPYPRMTQAGIIAVGHPDRQEFKPARRRPLAEVMSWNRHG
ncbi:MAG TPA: nitroreductase family protein [Nocardioides sp.]|uniref:nitroreductase family protein n=1 Tax=uncultured Nocardioides sp. TaxID=198441 RepID=UPI000ED2F913|nr:nitroreductase family protein [uncultured Nocardioides sp.]HCB05122.1 nitroreductase [Nocardioides sp.]HRD59813.1 nitroreductase family protein [Nocardioides sp.]HRI94155.1 nitroreductase family protein [Nocardioides sp.]HRK45283.1 nitroreductase family protein [Nocardioides sp.]